MHFDNFYYQVNIAALNKHIQSDKKFYHKIILEKNIKYGYKIIPNQTTVSNWFILYVRQSSPKAVNFIIILEWHIKIF